MATAWQEVQVAGAENRRELVLSGSDVAKRIEENGLDEKIYSLKLLNFLEISDARLETLSEGIGDLSNLTSLILRGNRLEEVPASIGKLKNLKTLDLSRNELDMLPGELTELVGLHTLNVNNNILNELPEKIGEMESLSIIDVSQNRLEEFPSDFFNPGMVHLSSILANDNNITLLSPNIAQLRMLKVLNLANNKLTSLPSEISDCMKLKDTNFKGNSFSDRRLGKMVEQCATKSVLDYIRTHSQKGKGGGKGGKGKKGKKSKNVEVDSGSPTIRVLHATEDETAVEVNLTDNVGDVRPHIVCCIVKDYDLESGDVFKKFISAQTKLHETLGQKRTVATIATHDLSSVKSPLQYDAIMPSQIMITPLGKTKEIAANLLVHSLWQEAEAVRKEKKRSAVSGIHKYLELVRGCPKYACLLDKDGMVISFPPITNCEQTKISKSTRNLLIEVTSSKSQDTCKIVLDALLMKMLELKMSVESEDLSLQDMHISEGAEGGGDGVGRKELLVQQVKVLNSTGNLKVVYPSRVDLSSSSVTVVHSA